MRETRKTKAPTVRSAARLVLKKFVEDGFCHHCGQTTRNIDHTDGSCVVGVLQAAFRAERQR